MPQIQRQFGDSSSADIGVTNDDHVIPDEDDLAAEVGEEGDAQAKVGELVDRVVRHAVSFPLVVAYLGWMLRTVHRGGDTGA